MLSIPMAQFSMAFSPNYSFIRLCPLHSSLLLLCLLLVPSWKSRSRESIFKDGTVPCDELIVKPTSHETLAIISHCVMCLAACQPPQGIYKMMLLIPNIQLLSIITWSAIDGTFWSQVQLCAFLDFFLAQFPWNFGNYLSLVSGPQLGVFWLFWHFLVTFGQKKCAHGQSRDNVKGSYSNIFLIGPVFSEEIVTSLQTDRTVTKIHRKNIS